MIRLPMLDNILGQPVSLANVLNQQTHENLHPASQLLAQCSGRVLITGMGASFFAALPAVQALAAGGRHVLYLEASELLHFGQGSWATGDVAILISRSGGSIETLELADRLTQAGVPYIAVTNIPGSRLTQHAHTTLLIGSAADQIIAVQTYTATLLGLLLLAEQVISPGRTSLAEQARDSLPLLTQHINHCLHASDSWKDFFTGNDPLYLLGRGSALASLGEGALLFHETAKAPAIAMSSGQFRHGPVEVVTPGFRAIVLSSPVATRSLDWQLAQDLRSMGASIRLIGPHPPSTLVDDFLSWPSDIPPPLLPIFDIIPLQIAAYRTALWHQIRPGDFRYAAEVTEKETGFPLLQTSLA